MMVGALEGRFLEMLVYALRPTWVLEIGTFSGYSSLVDGGGPSPRWAHHHVRVEPGARRRWPGPTSPAARTRIVIEVIEGPALDTVAKLDGPFDFVFIDADKTNYLAYYEAVLPKLAPGGLIAADNTLWSGRVVDDTDQSDDTRAIRAFNDAVVADRRVVCVQTTVRDGVTLIRPVHRGASGGA